MAKPAQRFLDPQVLGRIADLQLVAKTVVAGFLIGLHRSPYHGVSIDFAEYRPYNYGDDPRAVDWNVYARTDRHYIKKYHGETNAEIHIVLDSSASMGYKSAGHKQGGPVSSGKPGYKSGDLTKFDYACYLAASLAFFAAHQRDAVGLLLFDTEIRQSIPARARPGQLSWILHELDRARPAKGTDFSGPLEEVARFIRKRGMVVIISDFLESPEQVLRAVRELQFEGNDIILFHILDPGELEFELDTAVLLEDLETSEKLEVIPEYVTEQYRKLLQEHIRELGHACRTSRIDYAMLNTGLPLDHALFAYLSMRQRRI